MIDPEPGIRDQPPWLADPARFGMGILDRSADPKEFAETWIKRLKGASIGDALPGFIDLGVDEYMNDPEMHLRRLWDHFRENGPWS